MFLNLNALNAAGGVFESGVRLVVSRYANGAQLGI